MEKNDHRLELVGGEWEEYMGVHKRVVGAYSLETWEPNPNDWLWVVAEDSKQEYTIYSGNEISREAAMAAAEAALLEEIGKFVRVKE